MTSGDTLTILLQPAVTKAASFSGSNFVTRRLKNLKTLLVTLDITVAERDSADELYDFYITTGDGTSAWDLIHFPQIATTGAKRFTALVSAYPYPQNVTTAAPGVLAVTTGTLATVAGGANAIKSLGAGIVRHGPWGDRIGHELVVAGTVATGIGYSITVQGAA